jgi:hypothetical protein
MIIEQTSGPEKYILNTKNKENQSICDLLIYVSLLQHSMKTHKNTYVGKLIRQLRMQDIRPRALDECRFCAWEQENCRV